MKKITKKLTSCFMIFVLLFSLVTVSGCGKNPYPKGSEKNPFVLGISPMAGWYAWYGIQNQGIFEKNGVCVKIEYFPVYSDSLTAFYSGRVDGICIAGSDAIAPFMEDVGFQIVLVTDTSYGADGLVVKPGIGSVGDLKGKTVATEIGTLEHMFLLKTLEKFNMTVDDINLVNMTINDAGPAFIAGSVDAAVLWEPTLSMAVEGGGELLYSSKETPGLIPDTFAVRNKIIKEAPETVQKVVDSWFEGTKYLDSRDSQFIQYIADDAELSVEEYLGMLDGVTIYDRELNKEIFSSGDDYYHINYTLEDTSEFLYSVQMIDDMPKTLEGIVTDEFIR